MKKLLLTIALTAMSACIVWAQQTVTGTVTEDTGDPLVGVAVLIKGTTIGAYTGEDGAYSIDVPASATTLVFTYVGKQTIEEVINGRSVIDVQMLPDDMMLDEVVVTALGVTREKRALGYSVQEIDNETFQVGAPTTNAINNLQGKIAGVKITGTPTMGGSASILIRGANSITGNNQPLFVVDGTPIDNSNFNSYNTQRGGGGTDFGNPAMDINPDDIESVTVLKGPSAAALYGNRASNGVILITTKSGKGTKGIGISVNSSVTMDEVFSLPDYQNEYGGGYKQSFDLFQYDPNRHPAEWAAWDGQPMVNYAADESWGPRMDGQLVRQWYSWYEDDPDYGQMTPFEPNPDNIKDFYDTGITLSNNISLTGGNDKANARLSYTNLYQEGTIPNSKMERNTLAVNAGTKLTDKLSVSARINYVNTETFGRPSTGYSADQGNVVTSFNQWFQRQLDMDKMRDYKTADGIDRTWNIKSPSDLDPLYWENPYWVLFESPTEDSRERVFGDVNISYNIIPGLTANAWVRKDFYTDRREMRIASGSIPVARYSESVRDVNETNFEFLLTYNKYLTDDLSVAVNLGANSRQQTYFSNSASTVGGLNVPNFFNLDASIDRPNITDYREDREVNSVYGSANIGWKNMVFVDASLRNDWSSTLPVDNNSYLYPAVTGSFVVSELLPNKDLIFAKLRAGWAQVGNDTDPYRLALTYASQNPYGSNPAFTVPNSLNNSQLEPEITTSLELGAELRFFSGRLGLDVTYYNMETVDQILPLSVSPTSGYSSTIVNAGKMTNKGWEIALNATPVQIGDFRWDIAINWARNRNEVVELAEGQDNYVIASWGPSINARVGEPYMTIVTDGFAYYDESVEGNINEETVFGDESKRIVNPDGNFMRVTNKVLGSVLPDWTGGVVNTFTFKGVQLSAVIDFQKGGLLYSVSNRYGQYSGLMAETVGTNPNGRPIRDPVSEGGGVLPVGVTVEGTPNTTYMDAQEYFKNLRVRREHYTYDASFVKFREVRLAYSLPRSIINNIPFQGITLAFVGRNLAILHRNVPNVDPESAYGSGNIQGFENGLHPPVRSLGFNLQLKL